MTPTIKPNSTLRAAFGEFIRGARAIRLSIKVCGHAHRGQVAGTLRIAIEFVAPLQDGPALAHASSRGDGAPARAEHRPYIVTYESYLPPNWDDGSVDGLGY